MRSLPRPRGVVLTTLAIVGALLAAGLGVLVAATLWWASDLPRIDAVTDYRPRQHLQVFTADGVEIGQFGAERRVFVPIEQVPQRLKDAVLAVEDTGFHEHIGISPRGIARALVANATGGLPQGASTITQQVARTFFLSTRRTAERKVKEVLLALKIERALTKDQILELYLNQIFLGQRAYGFGAAARTYFGKTLDELTLAETAMLAGLPQNPGGANPVTNPERATRRQAVVLGRMVATGVITEAERRSALAEPLQLRPTDQVDVHARHVAEMARQAVVERLGEQAAYTAGVRVVTSIVAAEQEAAHRALRRALLAREARQPWRGPEDQQDLPAEDDARSERLVADLLKEYADDEDLRVAVVLAAGPEGVRAQLASGEEVRVTGAGLRQAARGLRADAPDALAVRRGSVLRVMRLAAPARSTPGGDRGGTARRDDAWAIVQWPAAEAAFVSLDARTGRVRALVGGFDFGRSAFNRATQAWRQPGSAFKPFLYSAAFEAGAQPDTLVDDLPWDSAADPAANGSAWNPQNADGSFDGPITVREALARSKNLASIRLADATGVAAVRGWAQRFGFEGQRLPANLTLALGSGSTTPLQLAAAYAVFANGGHRVPAVVIERITAADGQLLYEAPAAPPVPDEATRAIPARNAFLVKSLLADVTRWGTAARAQAALGRTDLFGKTGTTNDAVDAWFAGFAGNGLVGVAWMGFDEPRSLGAGESGGGLALPIWLDALRPALRGVPVQPLDTKAPPAGIAWGTSDWRYAEWVTEAPLEIIQTTASMPR